MAMHMSLRLAWHDQGWNGHICENPCNNPYCVGAHSYPGDLIATKRDLDLEKNHCGESENDLREQGPAAEDRERPPQ